MSQEDQALTLSNPRLLSAVYFLLLSVILTCIIDVLFYFLGAEQFLPLFKAIVLAVIIAACFGALFGEKIVHSPKPYGHRVFLWGFLMVIAALPFYDLGYLLLANDGTSQSFWQGKPQESLQIYLFVLAYSFIIAGFWLAIAAGLAAMYLRGRLVYDILRSKYRRHIKSAEMGTLDQNHRKRHHRVRIIH
ncbi:hypothetical protein EAS68_00645 [Legionella jordanis]|uniref:hypothetical protein n=1 Tax=Legionella jordanis TaxID=456 RepID=UPI000F0026DE|nr:hypothetical protein [Legionella jordanis]RMX22072.1 hypothetical protein EAS68_00645 [Legionella jordanis]